MDTLSRSRVLAAPVPVRTRRRARSLARLWLELLLQWQERALERHRLESLDDFMLKDIGLSRADVEREAAKPFWRP